MNTVEIVEFQRRQRIVVAKIGAFLSCLEKFSDFLGSSTNEESEIKEVRKLQPIVGEFLASGDYIHSFLTNYHYGAYSGPILSSASKISNIITTQTLPRLRTH
ncbi:MAG: hypothetical protein K9G33_13310 [Sneathiella sp.]|nr:hypothetical protein [Sneathiella sp.]